LGGLDDENDVKFNYFNYINFNGHFNFEIFSTEISTEITAKPGLKNESNPVLSYAAIIIAEKFSRVNTGPPTINVKN
jgi:hypothetical protein